MELRLAFADAEPADREAFERQPGHFIDTEPAQVLEQSSLDDAKHQLPRFATGMQTTLSPMDGSLGGKPNVIARRVGGDALIKHHRNVAAQGFLNLHRLFRRE